ncbi:hypothetical protein P7C73_g2554, partial [Tremellales sp. Uapishka_1]
MDGVIPGRLSAGTPVGASRVDQPGVRRDVDSGCCCFQIVEEGEHGSKGGPSGTPGLHINKALPFSHRSAVSSRSRCFASSSVIQARAPTALLQLQALSTESHHADVKSWLESFTVHDIPKDGYEVSYSRSSGPGGQSYYIRSPPALLLSSQVSRSAPQNADHALAALHKTIVSAGSSILIGKTSDAQKQRVQGLMRAEEGRRRSEKSKRSGKKASRRGDD